MRNSGLTILFLALFLPLFSFGQQGSLIIVPQKTIYKRTSTHTSEYRRTFEVRKPIIKGGTNRAAAAKIRKQLNFWKVFNSSFKDELEKAAYLESYDYEVKYNRNNLLSIDLKSETLAAYPDSFTKYFVFDIKTGKKLEVSDLFKGTRLTQLQAKVQTKMQDELKQFDYGAKLYFQQIEFGGEEFYPRPENLKLADLQGFSLSDKGLTFFFDYGFPHVIKSNQPPGEFFFTWRELKPFIKRDGLLGRFSR